MLLHACSQAQVAALRSELLMALWEKEDAARQQPAAAAVRGSGGPEGVFHRVPMLLRLLCSVPSSAA